MTKQKHQNSADIWHPVLFFCQQRKGHKATYMVSVDTQATQKKNVFESLI